MDFFFWTLYKNEWSEKNIVFDDKEINKSKFHRKKKLSNIEETEFDKTLISKKEQHGNKDSFKYLIGFNINNVIKPLCIKLPQMTGHIWRYNKCKLLWWNKKKEVPKEEIPFKCLSLIMLDSINITKNYTQWTP